MSEDQDKRIADLLSQNAPPARDPMFRIKVLELREQRQFQRRSFIMLAGVLVIILASIFAVSIGTGALKMMGALVVGAALGTGYLAFRGRILHILRHFSL
jgi:hypothetical protein